jgi:hypothetical protein
MRQEELVTAKGKWLESSSANGSKKGPEGWFIEPRTRRRSGDFARSAPRDCGLTRFPGDRLKGDWPATREVAGRTKTMLFEKRISMNEKHRTRRNRDALLENFAAELTDAAYPIALKHGVRGSSLDLELEMWKKLSEVVRSHRRDLLRG